ncbi:MAG TPA: V-type ATP synthase subunit F [Clostridiaceae bacterium]|jgi:V/A-type H+-transporting ATPase subunit F|nr:V-type ATP synthase subunit F [Clostridiaceae bacterium]
MYKIGVIGDKDSILGFLALGLNIFPVKDKTEAESVFTKLVNEEFALIYITETTAKEILPLIQKYKEQSFPVVVPIPGIKGSENIGMQAVRNAVERAVGANILFGN